MMNLKTFFKNIFETKEISDSNMSKFGESHVSRLTASNPNGIYDTMIIDTNATLLTYKNAINSEDVAVANKQGKTITTDTLFAEFQDLISQKEGTIRGIFKVGSPTYETFFPLGLTEYSTANKANIEMLMNRVVAAATAIVADLPPSFLPQFTDIMENYITARKEQLSKIGNVEALKSATATARHNLSIQLMKNLLIIASNNIGNTSMLEDYFDQSFIRNSSQPNDGSIEGVISANQTINIENKGINFDTEFILTNNGPQTLNFGIQQNEQDPVTTGVLVAPNTTLPANYVQLLGSNPVGSAYLNVTNPSALAGAYRVLIE